MKILLDECLDRRLLRKIKKYFVRTVPQQGWQGIKNGQLLSLAENEFDVFISTDRNLAFQQNLPKFNIAVIILHAQTNRLADLESLIPAVLTLLPKVEKRKTFHVHSADS